MTLKTGRGRVHKVLLRRRTKLISFNYEPQFVKLNVNATMFFRTNYDEESLGWAARCKLGDHIKLIMVLVAAPLNSTSPFPYLNILPLIILRAVLRSRYGRWTGAGTITDTIRWRRLRMRGCKTNFLAGNTLSWIVEPRIVIQMETLAGLQIETKYETIKERIVAGKRSY